MTTTNETAAAPGPLEPLFTWAGSKTWLGPHLEEMVKPFMPNTRIVEPFGGSLAVGLYLRPKRALVNDYAIHLISLYREIQAGHYPDIPLAKTRDEWWAQREKLNALYEGGLRSGPTFASLTFAVIRGVFRGFFKTNAEGKVTQGGMAPSKRTMPDWPAYQELFRGWEFTQGDWKDVPLDPRDLVIADPPYYGTWDDYVAGGFPFLDQMEVVQKLIKHPGPVILNNDERIAANYQEWGFDCGLIARDTKSGKKVDAVEVLALKGVEMPKVAKRHSLPELLRRKADLIEQDWAKAEKRKQQTRAKAKAKRAAQKAAAKKQGAK